MTKIILVVWLLTGRNDVTMQYAVKYPSEAACQAQASRMQDTRSGLDRTYPVKYAECVMEVKP